ncbi:MAG: D-alanyl-D-alanine carboxypeptidase/D-alanyl-D-alanine-endopeptidase, partial [Armatimonadetes bacterium]|nr:D-alanyl-D-alanine carboxypeptidase/D-alanyl-D-alanine-endopeptidase [Armatimonadota bacterium]
MALVASLTLGRVFGFPPSQVAARLEQTFSHPKLANARIGFLAADVPTGSIIYQRNASLSLVPASNAKLALTATALLLFGPDYRFRTAVYACGPTDGKGGVAGSILVAATADPTADASIFDSLAAELVRRGYHSAGGVLTNHPVTGARGDSATVSRQRLTEALAKRGFGLSKDARVLPTSTTTSLIMEHASDPLGAVVVAVNKRSANALADNLWRSVGWLAAGAPERMPDFLRQFWAERGLPVAGVQFADGSGLSRNNRATALFYVELLRYMAGRQIEWPAFVGSLAVAGYDGTLADRFRKSPARGRIWAKTGTMHDMTILSGYVATKSGGLVAFSSLINNVAGRLNSARFLQDRACEILADMDAHGPAPEQNH